MSVRFEIDVRKIQTNRALIDWYRLFGAEFISNAQALASGRIEGGSGLYERSFVVELIPGNPPILRCGNNAKHAIYVEEDTAAHDIEPTPKGRSAKNGSGRPGALRWFDPAPARGQKVGNPAAAVFAKKVHHPGTKGQHIVRDAVKITGENMKRGSQRSNFTS